MGFEVLDLYDDAQRLMRERNWDDLDPTWNSSEDAHPNPETHRRIAERIFDAVKQKPALANAQPARRTSNELPVFPHS